MTELLTSFMATATSLIFFGATVFFWVETFKTFDDAPAFSVFASIVLDFLGMALLICFIRCAKIFYVAVRGLL